MPATMLPAINPARCTGCGRCVAVCAPHVLSLHPLGWVKTAALDDAAGCTGCAQCRVVCPFGAVRMMRGVHEPRLTRELRKLIDASRVAALGTTQDDGAPFVSMVPFAVEPQQRCLVLHVSGLAAHTRYLQAREMVSLLVMAAEAPDKAVHDLPRVTLQGRASIPARDSALWTACKDAYLKRFPDVEPMTELGDFRFVSILTDTARHVAGFGAARTVEADELSRVLGGKDAA